MKRAMMHAARRVVVLADHGKIRNDCLARFGELSEVDAVITDSGLDDEVAEQLSAAGPRVVCA